MCEISRIPHIDNHPPSDKMSEIDGLSAKLQTLIDRNWKRHESNSIESVKSFGKMSNRPLSRNREQSSPESN